MRFVQVLPLAAISSAFVLPSQELFSQIAVENSDGNRGWYEELQKQKDQAVEEFNKHSHQVSELANDVWEDVKDDSVDAFDRAFDYASETLEDFGGKFRDTALNIESWLEDTAVEAHEAYDTLQDEVYEVYEAVEDEYDPRPGHGRRRRPHHPHHQKPNLTVYQLIAKSKYTTKLAELINEYDDLVEALNSTKANYTVFAPTDKAFAKIPDHAPKPSKEFLKKILTYHVVPEFYPAGRVLVSTTAPTLLKSDSLGEKPLPQRIAFKLGFKGLTVNFYSRVRAINIFATNGVIHGIDSILVPPPSIIKEIDLFPGEFSTLELGLGKTGLLDKLNDTDHNGGTFFAPSNSAFQKLGPKVNAFLFSQYGLKYLKALLEYHVVPDNTLYSDAFYKASTGQVDDCSVPKGHYHVDLPTLLKDRSLAIDIGRWGRFIDIEINAYTRVAVTDAIAEDGVIHILGNVIIPPKKLAGVDALEYWQGEEMSVEELMERLEPFVPKSDL